jgi:glucokinase
MTILAGDIGGTSTRLALFEPGSRSPVSLTKYRSEEHNGLPEMVDTFLAAHPATIEAAAFGVAGPVVEGKTETINLAWPVDDAQMATVLGLEDERVTLLNDLEANAWGIPWLQGDDLASLNDGDPGAVGNQAVISAGTGLGQAGLYWDGTEHSVFATEGGHADFAPGDELQGELLAFLRAELGHVSWERICSGMGLVNIERFLRARAGEPEPDWLARGGDASAAIGDAAIHHTDEVSDEALDLMIDVYGRQAGNLALTLMATSGVFVGGGIAPKILPRLMDGRFLEAFVGKGRFEELLRRIPVKVILNDLTALLGAARRAARDLPGSV